MSIIYSKWGYANKFGDDIVLNTNLQKKEYMALRMWILEKELNYKVSSDIKHEITEYLYKPKEISKQYFKFFFKHPSTWIEILPAMFYKGDLYWDLPKLWTFFLFSAVIGGLIWVFI